MNWVDIKEAQYAAKERDLTSPILVVTGSTQGADLGLFWIQFASYNINALLVLFWFVTLTSFLQLWLTFYSKVCIIIPRNLEAEAPDRPPVSMYPSRNHSKAICYLFSSPATWYSARAGYLEKCGAILGPM